MNSEKSTLQYVTVYSRIACVVLPPLLGSETSL